MSSALTAAASPNLRVLDYVVIIDKGNSFLRSRPVSKGRQNNLERVYH